MENTDRKKHWETIYQTKQLNDVSWYQPTPSTSLDFIEQSGFSRIANIIDIGGGDSLLVDHLLERGYSNITVLDISETAITRAQQRLGKKSELVTWIVADISNFKPSAHYDLWHDRAAFHFLTNDLEINQYVKTLRSALNEDGIVVVGTFSEVGPKMCSGIAIRQYSSDSISRLFLQGFKKIKCTTVDHQTPFDTIQNFLFCSFQKVASNDE